LGRTTTLNLNTGQSGPNDPIWTVNGAAAHPTSAYPGWMAPTNAQLNGAQWIQLPNQSTPASNVPAGDYKYKVRFNTPKCVIPSRVMLDVYFAADNSATVFVDGTLVPTTVCSTNCFNVPQAPVHFTVGLAPGAHAIDIVVKNLGGPSGLIVNAKVTRACVKENQTLAGEVDPS